MNNNKKYLMWPLKFYIIIRDETTTKIFIF